MLAHEAASHHRGQADADPVSRPDEHETTRKPENIPLRAKALDR